MDSLSNDEVRVMVPHLIGGELSPAGWTRFVRRSNESIDRIGAKLGVAVVSVSELRNPDQFVDVCHPNANGNDKLAKAVAKAIPQ